MKDSKKNTTAVKQGTTIWQLSDRLEEGNW